MAFKGCAIGNLWLRRAVRIQRHHDIVFIDNQDRLRAVVRRPAVARFALRRSRHSRRIEGISAPRTIGPPWCILRRKLAFALGDELLLLGMERGSSRFQLFHGGGQSLRRQGVDRLCEEASEFLDALVELVTMFAHGSSLGLIWRELAALSVTDNCRQVAR